MHTSSLGLVASTLLLASTAATLATPPGLLDKRAVQNASDAVGFFNVSASGGNWLTIAPNADGQGEPLNVVISAESDPLVLTEEGFFDFMLSVQMGGECLGQHMGDPQTANLGDGLGYTNQSGELRYDYGYDLDATVGTCLESIHGGNHLRYWWQNGSAADSGAIFMAVSRELSEAENHDIYTPDGYGVGRDELTGNATRANGTISAVTNRTFTTTSTYMEGYIQNTSTNVNHGITLDGKLAVWVVRVTSNGSVASTTSAASGLASGLKSWATTGAMALALVAVGLTTVA